MIISIPVNVSAERKSADLEATAGLKEAMSLTCNTASAFGVVTVDFNAVNGGTVVIGTDGGIGHISSGVTPEQDRVNNGACSLSGSAASEGTQMKVSYSSQPLSGDGGAFDALSAPIDDGIREGTGALLTGQSVSESSHPADASGSATINVGASLLIPGGINTDSFGGYSGTVTVKVDDEPTG